jgi:hypothetical protein
MFAMTPVLCSTTFTYGLCYFSWSSFCVYALLI